MQYDLVRMGSGEFEDMAVALCNAEFGPGGTSFGAGRDGGREWIYEGPLPMPKNGVPENDGGIWEGAQWDNYTVAQAKHKSILEGGKKDVDWLLTTIQREVKKWVETKEGRTKKPKNFLVITNVDLSSVPQAGGIDRVRDAMRKHATSMKLEGWAVWSAEHISRLLDNHSNIHRTYIAHVTVGDVLSAVLDSYENRNPEATGVITGFVAKELYAHRHVRLTRAGNSSEREFESLAAIGIDLPAVDRSLRFDELGNPRTVAVAESVIDSCNVALSPAAEKFMTVLIGGPGQGKSTIGQLICQAYRAALLDGQEDMLSLADKNVLLETRNHFRQIGLNLPTLRRWPVYIRLSSFSEKMLDSGDSSIQAQITEQINSRGGGTIEKSHLNVWLSQWPWLVVLDGLDEVPDAYTRNRILQKLNEFISDAAGKNADIAVIATTRPQGYQQDLNAHAPRELELAELNHDQALSYGKKLLFSRNNGDPARAKELYERLEGASKEAATAKLMGTPLQVSIMASLLEDRIRVPRTRYKLFDEFYETVYRRECGKEGRLGDTVEQYKAEIDKLHDGVGIRLHLESEKSGNADVHLSKDDLKRIAQDHLIRVQTYEQSDAEKTAARLVDLATDRLVLLVESSTDHWGFEVRSFQEFMASRFLTEGEDTLVLRRLKALARSSHWRNAWLFAAASVFESRTHLRERLVDILNEIDNESVGDSLAKPGARLATDLIADNFAAGTPGIRRRLLLQCIQLLDTPLIDFDKTIPIVDAASTTDAVLRRAVTEKFDESYRAGGRKQENIQSVIAYWSATFTGGIAASARTKLTRAKKLPETGHAGKAEHVTLGMILKDHVDVSDLKPEDRALVESLLQEKTATFMKSSSNGRLYGIAESHFGPQLATDLIQSDEACDALDQAFASLPAESVTASNWFVTQLAQSIGQQVSADEEDLELLTGGSGNVR
ncbi:NACHT domain-containing protein [Paenarthrobacter sp. NPDC092416]|uniref:NACHT domain-containing protein n=1 Tax=Paenarthrobacter sp. NPDC092416 TaxID=3364386 RepID=UPI00380B74DB